MRPTARFAVVIVVLLGACQSPTAGGGGAAPVSLVGQWSYAATQTSPVVGSITGTLTISQQSGRDFQGFLDAFEQDGLGNLTHVSGVISGQVLDTSAVTFSAFLGLAGRQHVGTMARDSLKGPWVEQTSGEVTSTGTFVAARRTAGGP